MHTRFSGATSPAARSGHSAGLSACGSVAGAHGDRLPAGAGLADDTGRRRLKIDLHVHVVGSGSGGTGSWIRPRGWSRWAEPWLLLSVGLGREVLSGDLDAVY